MELLDLFETSVEFTYYKKHKEQTSKQCVKEYIEKVVRESESWVQAGWNDWGSRIYTPHLGRSQREREREREREGEREVWKKRKREEKIWKSEKRDTERERREAQRKKGENE